jgi:hypothetical protein
MVRILIGVLFVLSATVGAAADFDADGVDDAVDNCRYRANADQADADSDGIGDVCIACGMLDAAGEFGIAVETTVTAKAGKTQGFVPDMELISDVCADRVVLGSADVGDFGDEGYDVIARRSSGVAVKVKDAADEFALHDSHVAGTIATGGGAVVAPPGTAAVGLDTSGTHPRLARCQETTADAAAASAAFAAMPPNETHLDLDVGPGEEITLDAGTPGAATLGVVNVRSLRVHGTVDPGYGCSGYAELSIRGPRSTVVNVTGKIELGPCALVTDEPSGDVILNAVGKGQVRLGPGVELFVGLLAPQRNVQIRRPNNYSEQPHRIGPVWARKLTMPGYTHQFAGLGNDWVCGVPQDLP